MKKFFSFATLALALCFAAVGASADAVYPYTNPTYIPTAISPSVAMTGTGTYVVTVQDKTVIGYEVNGTCTSLNAVPQVSFDGVTWRTINAYPVVTTTSTPTAAITAAGGYRANVSGAQKARLNVTALSATCNIGASATAGNLTTQ